MFSAHVNAEKKFTSDIYIAVIYIMKYTVLLIRNTSCYSEKLGSVSAMLVAWL